MSLDQTYDPDNIFAKIIAGDIPAAKIFEDDHTLAFMDAFPQTKGHALVISKTARAVNLLDMPEEALTAVILTVRKVAAAMRRALDPAGIRLVQFNGAPAGQSVFHTHFHLIPAWADGAEAAHGEGQADPDELKTLAEKISAEL